MLYCLVIMIIVSSSLAKKLTARYIDVRLSSRLFSEISSISSPYTSLYEELRTWRNSLAEELQKQPYHIVKNKVLEELCNVLPRTPKELYNVPGIGPKTMAYGDKILDIINKHVRDENNIAAPVHNSGQNDDSARP